MLQIDKPKPSVEGAPSAGGASPEELYLSLIAFLRRRLPLILFVLSLAVALGAVYLFTAAPLYSGKVEMIIDTRKVQVFAQQSVLGDIAIDAATVDSQVEIMKSEGIALSVIKDQHLTEDPEFVGTGGGFIGSIFNLFGNLFSTATPASSFELTRRAVGVFEGRLKVRRIGLTYVMEITFRSHNPERAAQIANAVADAYILDQLEAKYQTTRRAAQWLQDRLRELRTEASTAERTVVDFKAKNNIIDTGGRLMSEQQLAELNSQLIQARAQTAEAKARLDRVTQILGSDDPDPAATVTDTLHSEVITKFRQTYLEDAAKERDWSRRYGANHLAAVNLRTQMAEIRRNITDELKRIAETYESEYAISQAREQSVQTSLEQIVSESQTTNQAEIALRELESTSQTYRALYDNFLQRYMESVQQQSFPITEARVITAASRPLGKSSPIALLVMAVAITGGGILGVGLAMLRDISDRVFRTSAQIESALQTDCVAVVPLVTGLLKAAPEIEPASPQRSGDRIIKHGHTILSHVIDSPFSRFAESIRAIKVAIDLTGVTKANKVIGITSSLPNEGKSMIAAALAQLISQSGARVLLVDCDLRNPALSRKFTSRTGMGLIDVIAKHATLDEVIWTDPATKLSFLPTTTKGRLPHSSDLLASAQTQALFDRLREMYDYVVVDLSPLAPIVDVRATTKLVDSYLFLVEWGRTKIDVVEHVLSNAPEVYDNLLGVILNKADINLLSRYEGYRGKYYYNRYYARYGYTE
jgi:succinoglycan biosynthesis transport protein ExoP